MSYTQWELEGNYIYMKLHELLASYKGQELNDSMISAISSQVDIVKNAAVDKATDKFKDYEDLKTEVQTFRDEKTKAEFNENWTKAGGKKDANLDDYKFDKYTDKDGKVNFDEFFKAHPTLKETTKGGNNGGQETPPGGSEGAAGAGGVFSAIQSLNNNGSGGEGGSGGSDIKVY